MEHLNRETYIAMIKNSVGTTMFRNNFFCDSNNGKKIDVLGNGSRACAYFVSSVLKILKLIQDIHVTVDGTINDLKQSGWKKFKGSDLPGGAVIVRAEKDGHKHIGFYAGKDKAISNSTSKKKIVKHSLDYNGKRGIVAIYSHKLLAKTK